MTWQHLKITTSKSVSKTLQRKLGLKGILFIVVKADFWFLTNCTRVLYYGNQDVFEQHNTIAVTISLQRFNPWLDFITSVVERKEYYIRNTKGDS